MSVPCINGYTVTSLLSRLSKSNGAGQTTLTSCPDASRTGLMCAYKRPVSSSIHQIVSIAKSLSDGNPEKRTRTPFPVPDAIGRISIASASDRKSRADRLPSRNSTHVCAPVSVRHVPAGPFTTSDRSVSFNSIVSLCPSIFIPSTSVISEAVFPRCTPPRTRIHSLNPS